MAASLTGAAALTGNFFHSRFFMYRLRLIVIVFPDGVRIGNGSGYGSGNGNGNGAVAVMPRIIRKIDPVYPAAERNAGITGSGVVRLLVNTNGTVDEVTLVSSSGNANLDQAGINAAYKWRFTSAVGTNGQKVRCYLRLPFTFRLR